MLKELSFTTVLCLTRVSAFHDLVILSDTCLYCFENFFKKFFYVLWVDVSTTVGYKKFLLHACTYVHAGNKLYTSFTVSLKVILFFDAFIFNRLIYSFLFVLLSTEIIILYGHLAIIYFLFYTIFILNY